MFYHFRQNNSGGSFVYDDKSGITINVVVEADSAADANHRAVGIGLYFDGVGDCECCGNRWHAQWNDEDGDAEPVTYGGAVNFDLGGKKPTVYVHYLKPDKKGRAFRGALESGDGLDWRNG